MALQPYTYKRFGATYCSLCQLQVEPVEYCRCGTTPATDAPAKDGEETQLKQRILDVVTERTKASGR